MMYGISYVIDHMGHRSIEADSEDEAIAKLLDQVGWEPIDIGPNEVSIIAVDEEGE